MNNKIDIRPLFGESNVLSKSLDRELDKLREVHNIIDKPNKRKPIEVKSNISEIKKTPNNVPEDFVGRYQDDTSRKQYYPTSGTIVEQDNADLFLMKLGYIRQQLLLSIIDNFGVIDYNFIENLPKELLEIPENVIYYNNLDYRESQADENGKIPDFVNANVPIGWNIAMMSVNFGDFVVPNDILQYVKEKRANGEIPDSNIIRDEGRYKDAKEIAEFIKKSNSNICDEAILMMIGGFATEVAWVFKPGIINTTERDRAPGTAPYAHGEGCGEGWFGVTGVDIKRQICNNVLGKEFGIGVIANASREEWGKIIDWWISRCPDRVRIPMTTEPKTDDDYRKCIFASFLYKAGTGWTPDWEGIKKAVATYQSTHKRIQKKDQSETTLDGFAHAVYHAMLFSLYLKNEKVPKGDPWDEP